MGRRLGLAALLLALVGLVAASAGRPAAATAPRDFLWAAGSEPAGADGASGGDLEWRGGAAGAGAIGVETAPVTYVVYWGAAWQRGFRIADLDGRTYPSSALRTYVDTFLSRLGGSSWAGVLTQYCGATRPGGTSCAGGSGYVTNPPHELKGVWIDPAPVPANVLERGETPHTPDDPVAAEVRRAVAHFGWDSQATYVVLAPPGPRVPAGPVWCGYHSQAVVDATAGTRAQYAFVPWLDAARPGAGRTACGMHAVDRRSDAFGNGIFDGWSIVLGHEWAESVTDPDNFDNVQDGWNDGDSAEAADKCAWHGLRDIHLGANRFAVQPLWSNASFDAGRDGCVVS